MRKVILFMHYSLDGFVCGPNGEQDWVTMNDDVMGKEIFGNLLETVDTILTGRVLYQGFAGFWPNCADNPDMPAEMKDFAVWMNDTPKVVFSKTLETVEWKNSVLAKGDLAEEVTKLKQQPGGDMIIFGGAATVSEFIRLGLIDEYRLKLEPVVLGKGKRLFEDLDQRINLELVQSKSYSSGVVTLIYKAG